MPAIDDVLALQLLVVRKNRLTRSDVGNRCIPALRQTAPLSRSKSASALPQIATSS